MANDWKMNLYWRLPVRIQETLLSLYAWRLEHLYYGGEFGRACEELRARSGVGLKDIAEWQLGRLNEVLGSAAAHVPHYRRTLARMKLPLRSLEELELLPILDRQEIRQREVEFLDERLDRRRLFRDKTSGSTGTSLTIYWPSGPLQRLQAALEVRVREVAGVSRHVPRAMLGGRPIVKGDAAAPPYWRSNRFWKQLYLSSYHVSRRTAPGYIQAIREAGVKWLTGYGSAIAALADSAREAGVPPLPMQVVVVSGDTLQPGMRRSIEAYFGCKCYDSYGQVEGVSMAMECAGGSLHLVPEVGLVEILREDGSACARGEVGVVVATGLLNDGMPLIRYRTGDYAAWSPDQRCSCGSAVPILESLEGRVDDYLETEDGRRIGRLSTAMKRSPSIHSAQIVQERPGHAYLLVRPGTGYRPGHALAVRDDLVDRIGEFDFEIVEVAEIPRTPTGKTRLVVRLSDRPALRDAYRPILRPESAEAAVPR